MVNVNSLIDSSGRAVRLGRKLGAGGEGAVSDAPSHGNDVVAKLYHKPIDLKKQAKLRTMAQVKTRELLAIATWPIDTIHDARNNAVVGFLMPKMVGFKEIHRLYSPAHRRQDFRTADWTFLVQAARNTAAAIALIHKFGHVVGDINQNNVVVSQTATVKLIDCDSFQIQHGSQRFLCEVGVAHFTPPELHGKQFDTVVRTPNHDNFGLALLCFHLLFMGRHPYAGKFHNGSREMPIEKAIREFRFAYSSTAASKHMAPPPHTLPLGVLPPRLQSMFESAFSQQAVFGARPTAEQWMHALEALRHELVECSAAAWHKYHQSLSNCPWCPLELQSKVTFFVPVGTTVQTVTLDVEYVWRRIAGVAAPPAAVLPTFNFTLQPKPLALPSTPLPYKQLIAFLNQEKQRLEKELAAAVVEWEEIQRLWARHAADRRFETKLADLRKAYEQHKRLTQQVHSERLRLEGRARELQLRDYLDNYYIDRAKISGIGPVRTATLASYGIETAADVSYHSINAVPGFGRTLATVLLLWRAGIERNFIFDPNKIAQTTEYTQLQHRYNMQRLPLEKQLEAGPRELEALQREVLAEREALLAEAQARAAKREQCTVNLADVNSRIKAAQEQRFRHWFRSILPKRILAPAAVTIMLLFVAASYGPSIAQFLNGFMVASLSSLETADTGTIEARPTFTPTAVQRSPVTRPVASPTGPPDRIDGTTNLTAWLYQSSDIGELVGEIPKGDRVTVVARAKGNIWCRVHTEQAQEGWVYCVLLDLDGDLDAVPIGQE